jgi:hypothetical protein
MGYHIPDGLIYVGNNLKSLNSSEDDACLINPTLDISPAEPWEHGDLIKTRPNYSDIPPQCRGAYLNWLATGRSDPKTFIGYVFLFLYGLERRAFFDNQNESFSLKENKAISEEVYRLLRIYNSNLIFSRHALYFLAMMYIIYNIDLDLIYKARTILYDNYNLIHFYLALLATTGEPVPAQTAWESLSLDKDFCKRTRIEQCLERFQALFLLKYTRAFGKGITLKPDETSLRLRYFPANPSLTEIHCSRPDLKEPLNLMSSLRPVFQLAEATGQELGEYLGHLVKKDSSPDSLEAISLLPKELLDESAEPRLKEIRSYIRQLAVKCPKSTPFKDILAFFGHNLERGRAKKKLKSLAILAEKLGLGIIPDVRYYEHTSDPQAGVLIFPNGPKFGFQPSNFFKLTAIVIWLGSFLTQCDGKSHPKGDGILYDFITHNNQLRYREKYYLLLYYLWCLNTTQSEIKINDKLSGLSDQSKKIISLILYAMMRADRHVNKEELNVIEKIYTNMGFNRYHLLNELFFKYKETNFFILTMDEINCIHHISPDKTNKIDNVSLNNDIIIIKERETTQVREKIGQFLTDIEAEKEAKGDSGPKMEIQKLDGPHEAFLRELITRANWERVDLLEFCAGLGLMLDGALELINDWAYNSANRPLIEDGNPVLVDLALAEEIIK